MKDYIAEVRKQLLESADEKTRLNSARFFKESIDFYGVKVPEVNRISREVFMEMKHLKKDEVFDLCEELWKSGKLEESFVACSWTYALRDDFKPEDFTRFRRWIDFYVTNWASCDTLCNHTVGDFMMMYPDHLNELQEFTKSHNRWVRRAAAVSLIIPARKGLYLSTVFRIAENLLQDPDDLVQKGYGWMLKAASEAHRQEVFAFVMRYKELMPRTALRYAIEKMPDELRKTAMAKNKR